MSTTIVALLAKAAKAFDWGSTTQHDLQQLLQAQLSLTHAQLITHHQTHVSPSQIQAFWLACERCQQGEPLAYILGTQTFFDLTLEVTPDVLIPRSDTEVLVETVLSHMPKDRQVVLDLGTGSGAIALALAKARPAWFCLAIDHAYAALTVADHNRRTLGIPLLLCQANWASAIAHASIDILVANPPYLSPDDPHLRDMSLQAEPRSALVASEAGLADFIHIIADARRVLRPGGYLFLEHGWCQHLVLADLLQEAGFDKVALVYDYANHPRVTWAQWPLVPPV